MKKLITITLVFFVTVFSSFKSMAQLYISTNTTWQGTVYMTQDVIVNSGVTLTIAQGTQIFVGFVDDNTDGKGDVDMIVNGRLHSLGNPCNKVVFQPLVITSNTNWWKGINIPSADTSLLQCTQVSYATNAVEVSGHCETNGLYTDHSGISGFYANGSDYCNLKSVHSINDSTGIRTLDATSINIEWSKIDSCASNAIQLLNSEVTVSNTIIANTTVCAVYTEETDVTLNNIDGDASTGMAGLMTSGGTVDILNSSFNGKACGLIITGGGIISGDSLELTGTNPVIVSDQVSVLNRFADFAIFRFYLGSEVPQITINHSNLIKQGSYNEYVPFAYTVYGINPDDEWCSGDVFLFGWCGDISNTYNEADNEFLTPFGFISTVHGSLTYEPYPSRFSRTGIRDQNGNNLLLLTCIVADPNSEWLIPQALWYTATSYRFFKYTCDTYSNATCGNLQFCINSTQGAAPLSFLEIKTKISVNSDYALSSNYTQSNLEFNFQYNYWSTLSDVASNIYQLNGISNVNYSGFSPVVIQGVGCSLIDDGYTLNNFPLYSINSTVDVICSGNSQAVFTGPESISGVTYDWLYNGASYGATTPSIQPTVAGIYNLTISGQPSCVEESAPFQLVQETFISSATISTPNGTYGCPGDLLTLSGSAYSQYNLEWFFNGQSMGAETQITVSNAGTYVLSVTSLTGNCSILSPAVNIGFGTNPSGTISSVGIPQICSGSSILLRATSFSSNTTSFDWLLNGNSLGINNDSLYATLPGVYRLEFVTDTGCTNLSNSITVQVNSVNATITPTGNTTFCQGGSVTLTSSSGSSYLWSPGAATTQSISATTGGTYTVTVTDNIGCSATSSGTLVTVNQNPSTPSITPTGNTIFCQGGFVTLTSSSGSSYLWSPGGATTQSISETTGNSYTVTITNVNSCQATSSPIIITVNSNPSASFSFLQSDPIVDFTGSVTGGSPLYSYSWDFGDLTSDNILSPSHTYNSDGLYDVIFCATDNNACSDCDTNQLNIITTGINVNLVGGEFFITPNPNSGSFTVNLNSVNPLGFTTLEIFNSIGQLIQTETINNQTNTLRKQVELNVAKGICTIRLTTNGNVYSEKLIIK